jgi:hypothetical protein
MSRIISTLILGFTIGVSNGEEYCGIFGTDTCSIEKSNDRKKVYRYKNYSIVTIDSSRVTGQRIIVYDNKERAGKKIYDFGFLESGWFIGIKSSKIFIDFGTAPGTRDLKIFDINKMEIVYKDSYEDPIIRNDSLIFWTEASEVPNLKNCPRKSEYESYGLGAQVQVLKKVSLINFKSEIKNEKRCQSTQ